MPYKEVIKGIYKIQSKSRPERIYIGSAVNVLRRWSDHRRLLSKNKHHSPILQNHYNKYGLDDLDFEIIESENYIDNKQLLAREQTWIIRFQYNNTWKPFFNVNEVAGNRTGAILSIETLKKMSDSLKGKKWKDDEREMRIASMTGVRKSDETRKKMSKAQEGNKKGLEKIPWNKGLKGIFHHTLEERERMSARVSGENHPQFGKHRSKETIAKGNETRKKNLALKQQDNSI
jgi:group I intron endonuclease